MAVEDHPVKARARCEMCECFVFVSLASAEDALLAGALVCGAEADEEPRLLIFLLLLQAVV